MLPQSPLPPSLGKEVRSIKLPDMSMGVDTHGATTHNSKVYIRVTFICYDDGFVRDIIRPVLVYSTNDHSWSTLPERQGASAITIVRNHITLIGGHNVSTRMITDTVSTWYEEEGQWKQVVPPMPTRRHCPTAMSHDNLLLVTGGVAEDGSTVLNTTDVLDLTTMKWTTAQGLSLPIPLWLHHLALCGEYLYLVGGATVFPWATPKQSNSNAWRVKWSDVKQTAAPQHSQPQRGVWTRIADPPTLLPTATSCGGTLYTVGGQTRDRKTIRTVYAYVTSRNQWVSVGNMSMGRFFHCAVPLSSNTMFVAGGRVQNKSEESTSPLTELLLL